ncbi:MAG: Yip1 family protein [Litorilinea sp.]
MDFAGMIQTWRQVLTRPGVEVFQEEARSPNANIVTALIWIVIAAVITAIFGFLQGSMMGAGMAGMDDMFADMGLPPEVAGQMMGMMAGGAGLGALLIVPISFLIGVGITHLLAKVFGGDGPFGVFAYLVAAFQAPLGIASAVLSLIPFLGGCISFLLSIYGLVLTYFAVKAHYALSDGKAIAVVIIPFLLILFLSLCVAIAGVAMFAGFN